MNDTNRQLIWDFDYYNSATTGPTWTLCARGGQFDGQVCKVYDGKLAQYIVDLLNDRK